MAAHLQTPSSIPILWTNNLIRCCGANQSGYFGKNQPTKADYVVQIHKVKLPDRKPILR